MREPDFFIVGAPKCGTTALYTYIKAHPAIFMPTLKEPNFFCNDVWPFYPYTVQDPEEYRRLFEGAEGAERVGEASVWNLYSKCAASNIKAFNPASLIVIMLRNPVDMVYSLHSHRVHGGAERITDLRSALEANAREKNQLIAPGPANAVHGLFYLDIGRYAEQVQRYYDAFGRERVHVIIYDDFVAATDRVYRDTLRFLRVDSDFRPDFEVINANRRVRSRGVQRLMRHPSAVHQMVRALTPRTLRSRLASWVVRLNSPISSRPPMAPDLRRSLEDKFGPDVEALGRLLGRDLGHWTGATCAPAGASGASQAVVKTSERADVGRAQSA